MESIRWAFNFRNWCPKKEEWSFCLSLIQEEEKKRVCRFVYKKDAKASLAGRLLMRKVVCEKFSLPWSKFALKRTRRGKPFLAEVDTQFDFNVSHEGQWVVLAAESSGSKIGIDVMDVQRPRSGTTSEFFKTMQRQFTSSEWNVIKQSSNEQDQLMAFYRNWCLKEALVKSLGHGISYDLQSISFTPHLSLNENVITGTTTVLLDGKTKGSWHFEETLLDKTHIVAIAFETDETPNKLASFDILTFADLVKNCEHLSEVDYRLGEEFVQKEETPF